MDQRSHYSRMIVRTSEYDFFFSLFKSGAMICNGLLQFFHVSYKQNSHIDCAQFQLKKYQIKVDSDKIEEM